MQKKSANSQEPGHGSRTEIAARYAKDRHVCETVHRAMKRWMNIDVRGLCKESE
jgi:hypothetical protein